MLYETEEERLRLLAELLAEQRILNPTSAKPGPKPEPKRRNFSPHLNLKPKANARPRVRGPVVGPAKPEAHGRIVERHTTAPSPLALALARHFARTAKG